MYAIDRSYRNISNKVYHRLISQKNSHSGIGYEATVSRRKNIEGNKNMDKLSCNYFLSM